MFKINRGKGFWIEFDNGYSISVQFGVGSYCSHKDRLNLINPKNLKGQDIQMGEDGSKLVEIAVMDKEGNFCGEDLGIFEHDEVEGWCTAERVLEVMNLIAALEKQDV